MRMVRVQEPSRVGHEGAATSSLVVCWTGGGRSNLPLPITWCVFNATCYSVLCACGAGAFHKKKEKNIAAIARLISCKTKVTQQWSTSCFVCFGLAGSSFTWGIVFLATYPLRLVRNDQFWLKKKY